MLLELAKPFLDLVEASLQLAPLLAALLARPFALPGGWGAWFGGIQHTERIIILDDSFSMMETVLRAACCQDQESEPS